MRGGGICKPRYHYLWWGLFSDSLVSVSLGLISQGRFRDVSEGRKERKKENVIDVSIV